MRTIKMVALASVLAFAGAACGGDDDGGANGAQTAPNTVEANDSNKFVPETITVSMGTTVTWKNVGSQPHTIQAKDDPPSFKTGKALGGGETFTHTFTTAGSFPYVCTIHPGMEGTVTVA